MERILASLESAGGRKTEQGLIRKNKSECGAIKYKEIHMGSEYKKNEQIKVKDEDRKTYELIKVLSAMKHRPGMYLKKEATMNNFRHFLWDMA